MEMSRDFKKMLDTQKGFEAGSWYFGADSGKLGNFGITKIPTNRRTKQR